NLAVLLVGLALGPRLGTAALFLYLLEGTAGLPVFNPFGPGGIAQLLGPTGGYLLAYPVVAAIAGLAAEFGRRRFWTNLAGATLAEAVLFLVGIAWFSFVTRLGWASAIQFALLPFVFAEVAKIMAAAALAQKTARILHR